MLEKKSLNFDLKNQDPQESKSTGQVAIRPLNEEKKELCSRAIRHSHLNTGTIILPWEIRCPAPHEPNHGF